jgi:hypothetical protein
MRNCLTGSILAVVAVLGFSPVIEVRLPSSPERPGLHQTCRDFGPVRVFMLS